MPPLQRSGSCLPAGFGFGAIGEDSVLPGFDDPPTVIAEDQRPLAGLNGGVGLLTYGRPIDSGGHDFILVAKPYEGMALQVWPLTPDGEEWLRALGPAHLTGKPEVSHFSRCNRHEVALPTLGSRMLGVFVAFSTRLLVARQQH